MNQAFAGFRQTEVRGVPVLWHPDPRFKTFCVQLAVRRPLAETAAARSILPSLLMQGTAGFPTRPALARQMASLYGAMVAPGTSKDGEVHTLRFVMDCVSGAFLPGQPDLFGEGLGFLAEFLAHPRLDGEGFPAVEFERERTQAAHQARAIFDDKGSYAAQRAIELACEGEPMAIPEHGGLPAIEALNRVDPEHARQDFLRRGQLLLVAMGALPEEAAFLAAVDGFLELLPDRAPEALPEPGQRVVKARRGTVERADLQQSKLVLVFRLPRTDDAAVWTGRALFTSMLGGGPHSRLFREVREARSLAYYAQSVLDRHKSLLLVHVGLDEPAAPAVEAETLRQIDLLAEGAFTAEELDTARAGILSTISSLTDGIRGHMRYVEDQWNLGLNRTPEDLFAAYSGATAEQVAASVAGIELDYAYLLGPTASGEAN